MQKHADYSIRSRIKLQYRIWFASSQLFAPLLVTRAEMRETLSRWLVANLLLDVEVEVEKVETCI